MFIPGCGCCGGGKCAVCALCDSPCLKLNVSGYETAEGTPSNCSEIEQLTKQDIILRRGETCEVTIAASVSDKLGAGAKLSATLGTSEDGSYKYLSGVTVDASGSNYSPEAAFAYSLKCSSGGCNVAPNVLLSAGRVQPILTATINQSSPASGYGASLSPVLTAIATDEGVETWGVGSVAVTSPGTKYRDNEPVTFSDAKSKTILAASATVRVPRTQPSISGYIEDSSRYAQIKINLEPATYPDGVWWETKGATITYQYGTFDVDQSVTFYPSSNSVYRPETGAVSAHVQTIDENGAIASLFVSDAAYYQTDGSIASVTVSDAGEYYRGGGIKSAEVVASGKFYPINPCVYTGGAGNANGGSFLCAACPENAGTGVVATLTLGAEQALLTVAAGSKGLLSATTSMDGKSCDGLSFTSGALTASVSSVACTDDAPGGGGNPRRKRDFCDGQMPDQITLSLSGMGPVFGFASRGGLQTTPQGWCSDGAGGVGEMATLGNVFCGECGPEDGLVLRSGGTGSGIYGYLMSLITQDGSAVLDLVPGPCGSWTYQGMLPVPPSVSWTNGYPANVSCNGEPGVPVQVAITPVGLQTTVGISAPTKGGEPATAEVTSVSGAGAIGGVTLNDGGSGYAVEIIDREQPSMTVTLSGGTGTGAVLSATLTQFGTGSAAYWYVSAVTVTNGGAGYAGTETVVFTPEAGTTVESGAYAYIVTGRVAPTVTATAPGGTGASLSVTLAAGTSEWTGLDVWRVSAVSVTSGGTGYTDGAAVTFAVTDGVQFNGAYATIATGREEPTVIATAYGGTGAVLTPTLTQSGDTWSVSGLAITNAGTGYAEWDSIDFPTTDTTVSAGYAYVTGVNGSGEITSVTIYNGGQYYKSTGVIESVAIESYNGGEYYKSTGVIESVVVGSEFDPGGGVYYKLVPTGEVDADTPTVWFSSKTGSGATATATVDTDLESETFGKITGISVTSGGTGYKPGGGGWLCTVSGVGAHLAIKDSNLPATTAVEGDPIPCTDFESYYTTISERVTTDPCPTSLLSKAYKFSVTLGTDPFGGLPADQEASDGMVFCSRRAGFDSLYGYAHQHTFFDFGNGDITCTLAPA